MIAVSGVLSYDLHVFNSFVEILSLPAEVLGVSESIAFSLTWGYSLEWNLNGCLLLLSQGLAVRFMCCYFVVVFFVLF